MTQDIGKYIDEIEDYVGGNIEGNQIGIDRMGFTVFLRATLTKLAEEARREERERMAAYHRKQIEIHNHFLTEYDMAPFDWHRGRKIEAEEALGYLDAFTAPPTIIACKDPTDSYTGADKH